MLLKHSIQLVIKTCDEEDISPAQTRLASIQITMNAMAVSSWHSTYEPSRRFKRRLKPMVKQLCGIISLRTLQRPMNLSDRAQGLGHTRLCSILF